MIGIEINVTSKPLEMLIDYALGPSRIKREGKARAEVASYDRELRCKDYIRLGRLLQLPAEKRASLDGIETRKWMRKHPEEVEYIRHKNATKEDIE